MQRRHIEKERERERGACFWNKYEENFKSHKTVARWLKQVR